MEIKPNYDLSWEEMRKERFVPYEAFLNGYKPACYENTARLQPDILTRLETYPHVELEENLKMYFQSTILLQEFVDQAKGLKLWSSDAVALVGKTLGYPPQAVAYYSQHWERSKIYKSLEEQRSQTVKVGMKYAGIQFAAHIDDLWENSYWLWDTYQQDYPIWYMVTWLQEGMGVDFRVPYLDIKELARVEEMLREVLRQNNKYIRAEGAILTS